MKGGLSVGCRTKIFGNARCRLENENVKCRDSFNHWIYRVLSVWLNFECRRRPNLTLSTQCRVKNLVNVRCRNNPFHGPFISIEWFPRESAGIFHDKTTCFIMTCHEMSWHIMTFFMICHQLFHGEVACGVVEPLQFLCTFCTKPAKALNNEVYLILYDKMFYGNWQARAQIVHTLKGVRVPYLTFQFVSCNISIMKSI